MKAARMARSFTRCLLRVALLSLLVPGAGCFHGPDVTKIECTGPTSCPSGYACDIQPGQPFGKCHQGTVGLDGGGKAETILSETAGPIDGLLATDGSAPAEAGSDRQAIEAGTGIDAPGVPDAPPSDGIVADVTLTDTPADHTNPMVVRQSN